MLAGAAAVIVAGFAIGQVIDVGSDDADDSAGGSDVSADRAGPAESKADDGGGNLERRSGGVRQQSAPQPTAGQATLILRARSTWRATSPTSSRSQAANTDGGRGQAYLAFSAAGCPPPPLPQSKFGIGDFFPALFDGSPAVLALRPPADGVQQADVLACDTAASLASVTIAAALRLERESSSPTIGS